MVKIPYVIVRDFDLSNAPKGKIPWIELDGVKMGDSHLIIKYLSQKYGIKQSLTPEQEAVSLSFERLVSEHTAACMGYARNVEKIQDTFRAYTGRNALPFTVRFLTRLVARRTMEKLKARGIGNHSREEIYEMGVDDMKAISKYLGSKPYLFGDEPHFVDASIFAILASIAWIPIGSWPMKDAFFQDPELSNLQPYLLRMKETVWGSTLVPWYTGDEQSEE
jgi:glutathione S-transferase